METMYWTIIFSLLIPVHEKQWNQARKCNQLYSKVVSHNETTMNRSPRMSEASSVSELNLMRKSSSSTLFDSDHDSNESLHKYKGRAESIATSTLDSFSKLTMATKIRNRSKSAQSTEEVRTPKFRGRMVSHDLVTLPEHLRSSLPQFRRQNSSLPFNDPLTSPNRIRSTSVTSVGSYSNVSSGTFEPGRDFVIPSLKIPDRPPTMSAVNELRHWIENKSDYRRAIREELDGETVEVKKRPRFGHDGRMMDAVYVLDRFDPVFMGADNNY